MEKGALIINDILIRVKTSVSDDYRVKSNVAVIADFAFAGCTSILSIRGLSWQCLVFGIGVFEGCSPDLELHFDDKDLT